MRSKVVVDDIIYGFFCLSLFHLSSSFHSLSPFPLFTFLINEGVGLAAAGESLLKVQKPGKRFHPESPPDSRLWRSIIIVIRETTGYAKAMSEETLKLIEVIVSTLFSFFFSSS